jgi:hypothetical protein
MKSLMASVVVLLMGAVYSLAAEVKPATQPALAGCTLSGPYTHGNLTVFLIHGPDRIKNREFLTLQEAMEKKLVVVHETENVNELAVENKGSIDVYVQSGDIVKGGKQDRTIAMDFIVPAKSGKLPIASFCVENGRWQKRGAENHEYFVAGEALATKHVKLAAKGRMDQQEVWKEVGQAQRKLSENVGQSVQNPTSASSFQLTLENTAVQENTAEYTKALEKLVDGKNDVIGYAFAINGQVNSADIYGNSALFKKLWPKLIKASSVEAVAELKKDLKFAPCPSSAVYDCITNAERAKPTTRPNGERAVIVTRDGTEAVLFETRDKEEKDHYLHRNYIKK